MLNNSGTATWTNTAANTGRIFTGGGATINNSGTWQDQNASDNQISNAFGGAMSTFNNTGAYTKSGAGTTDISISFNNAGSGVVNSNAGKLSLSGGGTHDGSFTGAGGTLDFGGGTHTLTAASDVSSANVSFTGGLANIAGIYNVTDTTTVTGSGTANFNSSANTVALSQTGGTLGGTGSLTVSGPATWTAGTMTGAGATNTNGSLAISGANQKNLTAGRILNNSGTATWTNTASNTGLILTGGGATINNSGTWQDQNASDNQISNAFGGAMSTFNNTGAYTKSGAGTTDISISFNNAGTGVVNRNAGKLSLSGGGTHDGSFTGTGGTLDFGGGTHTLTAPPSVSSANVSFTGGTANIAGSYNVTGTTTVTGSGTANFNSSANTVALNQTGGTLGGTGSLTVSGPATWTAGTMTGAGTTNTNGSLTISGANQRNLTAGRILNNSGTATWTNTASNTGLILTGGGGTINNSGTWQDQNASDNQISNAFGGAMSTFNNTGAYTKSGAGTTDISISFNNAGTGVVNANAGTLNLSGGTLNDGTLRAQTGGTLLLGNVVTNNNLVEALANSAVTYASGATATNNIAGTLTGGLWIANAVGGSSATITLRGSNITTNNADIYLQGAGSVIQVGSTSIDTTLATNNGSLRIQDGRVFNATANSGNFTNTGNLELSGGSTFQSNTLNSNGTVTSFGNNLLTTNSAVTGSGAINSSFGTLTIAKGVDMPTGIMTINPAAAVDLSGATATNAIGVLNQNGSLNLGSQNIVVSADYNNANFGSGNAFDKHAGVSGTGLIFAAGATPGTAQTLSGNIVGGGPTSGDATITFGNVHVGDVITKNYQIGNANVGGPELRGAIQTAANGGNITDTRLTGSGVTAGNFGPVIQGGNSGNLGVTLNATSAGALTGQQVHILNNFDNTNAQNLALTGAAYNLASAAGAGVTPNPVVLANQREGGSASQVLTITNTAPNGSFTEKLNGSVAVFPATPTPMAAVSICWPPVTAAPILAWV